MATYWESFWPELAATLVGVVVGVPLALLINRWTYGWQQKRARAAAAQRLATALTVVLESLTWNRDRAKKLGQVEESEEILDSGLEVGRWEVVRDQVVAELGDAELQGKLAYFFSQVSALDRLVNLYNTNATNAWKNTSALKLLRKMIDDEAAGLVHAAHGLDKALDKQIAARVPRTHPPPRARGTKKL
jgi:hypothetical protein